MSNPTREHGFYHTDSPLDLAERREVLPLNGETAFADTAAACSDLREDARLMYRIVCKGEPSDILLRNDTEEWIDNNIVPPYRSPQEFI